MAQPTVLIVPGLRDAVATHWHTLLEDRLRAQGRPVVAVIRIDAHGGPGAMKLVELPVGEPGELCLQGPQVMKGYWRQPEETARTIDRDGWLHTGDIARIDEKGFIFLVDRKKDMILVSGFNVYPNEVEDVMAAMPGIREVAAVGVPSEKSGETVKLVVVRSDPALTVEQIKAYAKANLTGYKRPHVIEFRNELPKSNVGKILRRELRGG